jgi:hypothetical protein
MKALTSDAAGLADVALAKVNAALDQDKKGVDPLGEFRPPDLPDSEVIRRWPQMTADPHHPIHVWPSVDDRSSAWRSMRSNR